MNERVGQQVGNYRLVRLIGEGGFADVYLGEHLYLGTQAAIKLLHTQLTREDVEQFRSEARLIAHLEHPNVVKVLDFGVDGKVPYLVMSYAPNGTLRQYHRRGVPLQPEVILPYVKQIAGALQYAHNQRLIHRDVKPENMLLGRQNEVLLSDFGIALVAQSSRYQSTRDVIGTVAYMAPEQIQGKPRPASDQYALGVVVYEWLCGTRPFHGSFTEVAVQHTVALPPPLREKIPTLSPAIEEVVLMALAKDPEKRFASVQVFAHALEQACLPGQHSSSPLPRQPPPPSPNIIQGDLNSQPTIVAAPPVQPTQPTLVSGPRQPEKGTSRRTFLIAIAGTGLALAGSGLAWWEFSRKSGTGPAASPAVSATSSQITHASPTPGSSATSAPTATPTRTPGNTPVRGTTLNVYRGHSGYVYGVTWAALDGQRIASAGLDKTVRVWNAISNTRYFDYAHSGAVNDVKASPNKLSIASAGEDSVVQVRDAVTGASLFTYRGHSNAVNTVEWASDNARIVSAGRDNTVQVWNSTTGTLITTYHGHSAAVWAAGWSPDGRYVVSVSADGTAQVWDALTGGTLVTYRGHTDEVRSVSWSPDGQRIATAGNDRTVQVWNATTGGLLITYRGHTDLLRTVTWSHDGSRIVSGARDATAQIWDPTTGNTLFVYRDHTATVFDAQWSPDGTHIASGSTDTTVRVWQAV